MPKNKKCDIITKCDVKISKERILILKKTTIYYMMYVLKITVVAMVLIFILFLSKYKPMYKVTIAGETVGYVTNKKSVEKIINDYINTKDGNVAFVNVQDMPNYELNLVTWDKQDTTQEILQKIKDISSVTYRLFAITVGEESKQYVSTLEEAEQIVEDLKKEFDGVLDLKVSVEEIYTSDLENIESIDMQVAKTNLDTEIISNCDSVISGIILSKPVTGTISSRFGTRWGRSHTGIDISAPTGTPIYSCSKGTVEYTGWYYGYGNLVIVDHGNGIKTYYGHCSKICTSVGEEVTKDTVIALVGSTGNSTGPHLHLEIRKDGVVQNPQNYLYK